jgi:hypothetical protein
VRASSNSVTTQALLTCPKTSMSDQRTATSVLNTANYPPPVGVNRCLHLAAASTNLRRRTDDPSPAEPIAVPR